MKKKWKSIAFLAAVALVAAGCASTTLVPAPSTGNANARPPQTGTNIPRRIQEAASDTPFKEPSAAKRARAKAKPSPAEKPPVKEEVVTRGGFR